MRDSIHKYFKLGTIQWMSHPTYDVLDSISRFCSDPDLDALEVCHFKDDETRAKAKRLLEQSHMKVCFGAQPTLLGGKLNPNAIDEAERQKAEDALMGCLDEAEYLGAKGIAFLAGKWEEETKDQAFDQLVKTTVNVCKYAATKDMMVELEVFDFDVEKASLIGPAPYAAQYAAAVRSQVNNFGLMVDLSHFPITYEKAQFVVQNCRPYITHLHMGNAVAVKDAEGYGDQHQRFGFPNGTNDTEELLDYFRVLKAEGFFRADDPLVLSFEVKPWKDEDPDIIYANSKRVLNRAWALLED